MTEEKILEDEKDTENAAVSAEAEDDGEDSWMCVINSALDDDSSCDTPEQPPIPEVSAPTGKGAIRTVKKNKIKLSPIQKVCEVLKYVILSVAVFITLAPMVVILLGSFKGKTEILETGVLELPKNFANFENYVTAFVEGNMMKGFVDTAIILVFSLVLTILTGTMTAYVLSRFKFPGKGFVKFLFLLASLLPSITLQVTTFPIINDLGLYNTFPGVIILFGGTDIISIYIFLQFLDGIPQSIDEAAIVDGASYPRVFFSIILPLLKPAIATTVIIKGVGIYNEFYTPNLYLNSKDKPVISTALHAFRGPFGSSWEIICAGIIITMIPTVIAFLCLQKWIYAGLTQGAVKE